MKGFDEIAIEYPCDSAKEDNPKGLEGFLYEENKSGIAHGSSECCNDSTEADFTEGE